MIIKKYSLYLLGACFFTVLLAIHGLCETNVEDFICFGDMKTNFHISYLSLIDAETNSSTFYSQEAALINRVFKQTFIKVINEFKLMNFRLNEKEQILKNTENNKKQLIKILTEPGLFIQEKTQAISTQLKTGSEIDAIFLGEYRELNKHIEIYVYWILFRCQTYFIEKIIINRNEFFCQNINGSTQFCKTKKDQFEKIILGLFFNALYIKPPVWDIDWSWLDKNIISPKPQNHYISHLSFMDPTTGNTILHTNTGKLINDAVIKGINQAQKKNPLIKHNAAGHILEDKDTHLNRLVNIVYDRSMNKRDKINKIVNKLMIPADIDLIITGQYFEKGDIVDIRPFIISKKERYLVIKAVQLKKSEFLCTDPINPKNTVLCKGAQEEISRLTKELLEQEF